MTRTCKNCRYWEHEQRGKVKECTHPKFIVGYHARYDEEVATDGVRVEGDEGWGFLTGPDFGCIHFEKNT